MMASTVDTSKDPIYQTLQGIWDCLVNNSAFAALVPANNRYTPEKVMDDKPGNFTADMPEVRVAQTGLGTAQAFRTSNSSSLQVQFEIQVKTGDKHLELLTELQWAIYCGMSHWKTYILDKVTWEGEKVCKRVTPLVVTSEYAPKAVKPDPAGWTSVWAGVADLFITTTAVQAYPDTGS